MQRVAIVTGGASGIGEGIARSFAEEGVHVVIADRNHAAAQNVANQIGHNGVRSLAVEVDITAPARVQSAVTKAIEQFGRIDILVNCAGWNTFAPAEKYSTDLWEKIRSINLDGTWNFCQAVLPHMREARRGKILNIGSAAGMLAIPNAAAYSTAKCAVIGLTRALAVDYGPHGITVNCVCPTTTETKLALEATTPTFREQMRQRIPLGRLGKLSDVANAVAFLASDKADFITGVVLPVDGGLTCCLRAQHYE